ncbi:MAG: glutamate--tRNA ligase [Deltaproteobacteria bacterium]|nr:MAG: glutamate--tRNA ligase [Deltaproteobacteria bacterium]
MSVKTRFAPSPTGYLHIGGARTALFNWLFARNQGGTFVLRIEDTDSERSTEESAREIVEAMEWLGLNWDEGPYFQSQRLALYREYVERLLSQGKAYRCYCTKEELEEERKRALSQGKKPRYNRRCLENPPSDRKEFAVRFLCPDEGETVVEDLVKGTVVFKNDELDDLIILRSDGMPTYNFTVVIDDALMGITHVLRGDDHLNNTPRQIQLYRALDLPIPRFGHLPMILGHDRTRLSKRHGAMSVLAYRDMGYLPEAVNNYLVRLGWSFGDQEIFTMEELIEKFSLDNVGTSAGVFNPEKMLWVNHQHLKMSPPEEIARRALPFFRELGVDPSNHPRYVDAVRTLQERSKTLKELAESGLFYFTDGVDIDEGAKKKFLKPSVVPPLTRLVELLKETEPFTEENISRCFEKVMEEFQIKLGKIAQPCRVALTGKTVSPGIFEVIYVLGKEEAVKRLEKGISLIPLDAESPLK